MNGEIDSEEEPLQGIREYAPQPQPEEQPDTEEAPDLAPPSPPSSSVPVRLEWFGRKLGEYDHAANFGPDGTELQDHHVAISPNNAHELGLKLGDWVWVGPQLRQYGDHSYRAPGQPNQNVVEVRDEKADGHTTLRKATDAEVKMYAPSSGGLSAQQASVMTGKPVEAITHADLDQLLQPQIEGESRGLIAGEPTAASYEQAQEDENAPGGRASDATTLDAEEQIGSAGLNEGSISGDYPVPPTRGLKYTIAPDGTITYENGVVANPRTDTVTWQAHGRTFTKMGRYGTTRSDPTVRPWKGPDGNTYDLNTVDANGNMKPLHPAGMIQALTPDRAVAADDINTKLAAIDPNLPEDQRKALSDALEKQRANIALGDLTPDQQNIVKGLAEYRYPVTAYALRNPQMQYAISRATVLNPNFTAANYDVAKRMLVDFALTKQGTAGGQIRSINQVIAHLSTLDDLAQQMNSTWNPKYNSIANWLSVNSGKPIVKQYETAANQVALEVARAFKGSAPDQADINRQLESLSSSSSPEQFRKILRETYPQLLGGALETLDAGFQGVMGKELPKNRLIQPATEERLLKMGITNFAGRNLIPKGPTPAPAATKAAQVLEAARRVKATSNDPEQIALADAAIARYASPTPTPTP
ncbi:MAG: hypothetical protein C5B54_00475 [Acidobacteria bacterium]|nr:MAG: hypothetical protein C5B54_00475 [Acidobacteriota bacterium]